MENKKDSGCGMYVFAAITVIVISFYAGYSYGGSDKDDEIRKEVMTQKEVMDAKKGEEFYKKAFDLQSQQHLEWQMVITSRKADILEDINSIIKLEKNETKEKGFNDLFIKVANIDNLD